jgi:hypothetical protein
MEQRQMSSAALPFPPQGQAVEALAEGVMATVRMARVLAEGRRRVDLAGLNEMVGVLCARMLDLPLDEGRALRGRLETLDRELMALQEALPEP